MQSPKSPRRHLFFNKQFFVGINRKHEMVTDKYSVVKKIGKGGYGIVYEIENKITKDKRACKVISKHKTNDDFERERDIMLKLDHPNIIKLYDIYEDQRFYYLVMEECEGGELFDKIIEHIQLHKMYSEKEAALLIKQVLMSISYCHERGICHRDLKPENLLFLKPNSLDSLKIIDFGLSKDFGLTNTSKMTKKVGTAYYVAPEVLRGDYNPKCDIWSAGVILYILLSGDPPFNGRSDNEIYSKINKEKYDFPEKRWANISEDAKDLIKHMLCPQSQRYSAVEALQHKWFKTCEESDQKPINFNLEGFKNYVRAEKFKKIILTYIADRLNEEDIMDLRASFLQLDTDHNGSISYEELKNGLKKYNLPDEEVREMFDKADTDKNGVIDYTEYIAAAIDVKQHIREVYLTEAFMAFDVNKDNTICKEDLMTVLRVEEGDKKVKCIENMIKQFDKNNDGKIDYNEFMNILLEEK